LRASTVLQAIYNDVDFSDFTYTRAMLGKLHSLSPEWFDIVVVELREAWVARMKNMLGQIGPNAVLFWFAPQPMTDDPWDVMPNPLQTDPLFITKSMIDDLRPLVRDVVQAIPTDVAKQQGTKGMYFAPMQTKAASEMLGVACHMEASNTLANHLKTLI
jgi:hypothetical protein